VVGGARSYVSLAKILNDLGIRTYYFYGHCYGNSLLSESVHCYWSL